MIYARKSSEDKTETSIPTQIEDCKEIFKRYSFIELTEIYQEDGVSGMFTDGRPQYQAMIREIAKGNIDVVIVMRLDRFGRNMQEQLAAITMMRDLECYYIAGDEIGDPNTAEGELVRGIMLAINQHLPRQVARNTMSAMVNNVKSGDSAGGRPPYGYKLIEKRYYIDEDKAPAVRIMFKKISEGGSYRDIVTELNRLGYKANNGKQFDYSSISCMLRNPKYYGTYIYNKTGGKKRKNRVLLEDFGEIVNTTAIPPIITKKLFDKVQNILENKRMIASQRKRGETPYILTGLLFCKSCGKSISGFSQSGGRGKQKYRAYQCPNHIKKNGGFCQTKPINAEYLESAVKNIITHNINEYLKNTTLSKEVFDDLTKRIQKESGIMSRHVCDLESKISVLTDRVVNTTSPYTINAYEAKISKHSEDMEMLKEKISECNKKIETIEKIRICSLSQPVLKADDIFSSDEESRAICRLFIKKIEIDDQNDEIEITFNV